MIAANRSRVASNWAAIMSLTPASSGVPGRRMSSRRAGTSGAYLWASLANFGPVRWMMPTALSVKSDALITQAHGLAARLAGTCSRYCSCSSRPGSHSGLVTAATRATGAAAEPAGQHRQGRFRVPLVGQAGGVVSD
jgi:hypothetical protein